MTTIFESVTTLNERMFEMKEIPDINDLLKEAGKLMENMDAEDREILRESLSMTLQRKLARLHAAYLADSNAIPLSPVFQEKLVTYLALSDGYEDDQKEAAADADKSTAVKAVSSGAAAMVEMYQQTKAAVTSDKEGDLFDCFAMLQEGLASPPTHSIAACCLRHMEKSLRDQIISKSKQLGLQWNEGIDYWNTLDEVLQSESCRDYPKEYFRFFYYDLDQKEFGFDEDAFKQATCPF